MAAISGLPPVGSIIAIAISLSGFPSLSSQGRNEWVPCNGQVLKDPQSLFNGKTLPSLNTNSFLRGQATSGGTGGTDSAHSHPMNVTTSVSSGAGGCAASISTQATGTTDARPAFYNVNWHIRIK